MVTRSIAGVIVRPNSGYDAPGGKDRGYWSWEIPRVKNKSRLRNLYVPTKDGVRLWLERIM